MPGIVGLITKLPRAHAERELHQMVAALCHESFYQSGTWIDETLGVYAGWVERQGSCSGGMPVSNEQGDVVVVFSGEEFSEPERVDRPKERGHRLEKGASSY